MSYYSNERQMPTCPICGEECNEFYVTHGREIVGCERCISTEDAYERTQEDDFDAEFDKGWNTYSERL